MSLAEEHFLSPLKLSNDLFCDELKCICVRKYADGLVLHIVMLLLPAGADVPCESGYSSPKLLCLRTTEYLNTFVTFR